MRILVVGGFESSSQRAHAINTVKMAQGFARCGHAVTLVCRQSTTGAIPPDTLNRDFGITAAVRWIQLPHTLGRGWRFAVAVLGVALAYRAELVYARSFTVPRLTCRVGIASVAESHAHVGDRSPGLLSLTRTSHHEAFGLWVTISDVLRDYYRSLGAAAPKLVTLPDAVDLEAFTPPAHLPPSPYTGSRPRVVYCGHLYEYKGIPTVLAAAKHLPDLAFHLVGGLPEDVERTRRQIATWSIDNVTLHGHRAPAEVPPFLWHADVLLLPPSAHHPSARWTSPVKLGEYLASGVPVVSTSIPALRDWLTDAETHFVKSDDSHALAAGIRAILAAPLLAARLSEAGLRKARTLAYKRRAEQILNHPEVASRIARGQLRNVLAGVGRGADPAIPKRPSTRSRLYRAAGSLWRRYDDDFQPLFICGAAGSGTTLMSGLLDQRFENSAVFHESALRFPAGAALHMESVGSYGHLDRYQEAMWLSPRTTRQTLRDEMLSLYRHRCAFPKLSNAVIDKAPNVHLVRAAQLQAAFPNAHFILIFRDPSTNLEGLRRKWTVFRDADLEALCAFWQQMHRAFMDQTRHFPSHVRGISFERLLRDPDRELDQLAAWCALTQRVHPRTYADRPNDPGKGLRGVVGGAIRVDPLAARASVSGLTDEQRDLVNRRLSPLYQTLVQRYDDQPTPG